jgi:hypothetical protein
LAGPTGRRPARGNRPARKIFQNNFGFNAEIDKQKKAIPSVYFSENRNVRKLQTRSFFLQIMAPRRRLRQESFQDDEAAEDNSGTSPPRSVVQRTQSFSPSPQSYRPLNMSGFGGRPSPGSSNAGGANRFHVTLKIANKRGLVKVKMQSASGNTFSEPLNKVMREMEDDNGSVD